MDSNDDETNSGSLPVPVVPAQTVTHDGSPDLVARVRTTLEGPELHPLTRDDTDQVTAPLAGRAESEVERHSGSSGMSFIYVDYSVPAVLSYSETVTIHPNLREAIAAWLSLPNDLKRDALITTNENGEARYQGWEIYRLWGHWDS
jgi:hypothetical protein